ncbi:MAG: hypothetical protein QNL04_09535 [SAR324 cluster bacterium]|nr:hypothetical protein [SAR324 cluster bacterium]
MKRIILLLLTLIFTTSLQAEIEFETDPIAFALKGHSAHIAFAGGGYRLDLGTYGLELPEDTNNPDYTVVMTGQGFKLDYYGEKLDGWFSGIQGGRVTLDFTHAEDPTVTTSRDLVNYGARVGYRFGTKGFYISPWIGVDKFTNQEGPVNLGGSEYQWKEFQVFPTVHLGYSF